MTSVLINSHHEAPRGPAELFIESDRKCGSVRSIVPLIGPIVLPIIIDDCKWQKECRIVFINRISVWLALAPILHAVQYCLPRAFRSANRPVVQSIMLFSVVIACAGYGQFRHGATVLLRLLSNYESFSISVAYVFDKDQYFVPVRLAMCFNVQSEE